MKKVLEFLRSYFSIILAVIISAVSAIISTFYLSSKVGTDDQSFLFWVVVSLVLFAAITTLFLLLLFIYKKRKSMKNTASGKVESDLKAVFKKLKRKKIKKIPLILFTSTGESNGDELFSRANFNLLQLNKKQDNGFSVWYSPEFMVLDVGAEFFDITCASSPLNKKFTDLLRFLRKARRHAPINSCVISLPFNYFSHTDRSDLENNAKNIAKKMEYIQHVLRIRFPAYLLIDRADLVYGFYDYATSLGDNGFKQMVGWSSELKINEVLDEESINNYFEEFSNDIRKPLYKEQNNQSMISEDSGISSFCFCKTIRNIIPSLKCFIENVFSNATWHFNPLQLRGVYFTAIKSNDRYSYMSYCDVNSSLRYCKIPLDKQSQKSIKIKDKCVFFLEDLFRNKILKESNLIVYTDSFLLFTKILKGLLLVIVSAAIFLFIYYSFVERDSFSKETMATRIKSWEICSNVNYWRNGKFSPLLVSSGDGKYSLRNSTINEKDNLAFILDFYRQNDARINIPAIYLLPEWIVRLNKQKDRARNTILYTSIINPLLEAFLQEYAVKVNKFDDLTAEIFANVFEYAKILCDYEAGQERFFHSHLGSRQISGLSLYLEDAYRYLFKSLDKDTDNKLKLLANVKIDLQHLFDANNLPYGIDRSFNKLKKTDFMTNKEVYQSNVSKLIDFCVQDYTSGPKSVTSRHYQINKFLKEFLADARNYKSNKEHFFQTLSVDEIIKRGENLKNLVSAINEVFTNMTPDNKSVIMKYAMVAREQDSLRASHLLIFDIINNTVKFDVTDDFKTTLFYELGMKKSLCQTWLFNGLLTKEQNYLFYPFYEMFNPKGNKFLKQYASEFDTLKSDLLYSFALKSLVNLVTEYNGKTEEETVNDILVLLDNKEIKRNENIDFVVRYLVEFSIISKYLYILSKSSFPFTLKELQPDEDLVRNADWLNNVLDGLMPPNITIKEGTDKTNIQPVKFQEIINAEQNLPQVMTQWVSSAKKIIAFIHANRDFISKVYLLGRDYSKDFKQNNAADVWVAVEIEQENSDYKPIPTLTRTKDNFLLNKVELTSNKPLKVKFYRTLDSLAKHDAKEYLSVGTLPLLKFMIDNPSPVPMFNNEYSITWKAAKFDKDIGVWISKISFVYKGQKELNMYIAFTMPEGAECLKGCLESEAQKLILKKLK